MSLEQNYEFFLKADLREHTDEWIAIVDKKVVACGKTAKEVLEAVGSRYPDKRPMLARIPGKHAMIL